MRVLAIRGRNLASLEGEFSIDFTEEPLASAGIFAISGPTGRENPRCWMPCASPSLLPYAANGAGEGE